MADLFCSYVSVRERICFQRLNSNALRVLLETKPQHGKLRVILNLHTLKWRRSKAQLPTSNQYTPYDFVR